MVATTVREYSHNESTIITEHGDGFIIQNASSPVVTHNIKEGSKAEILASIAHLNNPGLERRFEQAEEILINGRPFQIMPLAEPQKLETILQMLPENFADRYPGLAHELRDYSRRLSRISEEPITDLRDPIRRGRQRDQDDPRSCG